MTKPKNTSINKNSDKIESVARWTSRIAKFLTKPIYFLVFIAGFYIILLIAISLLIREEDKSFKNIMFQLKKFLSTIVLQISFLGIAIIFGLLASLPMVYLAKHKASLFTLISLIIIITLLLFLYIKRVVNICREKKNYSITLIISSLFPAWFKILFWILFTLYFLPFTIGFSRINIFLGILIFLSTIFIVNILFYMDKVVIFLKRKTVK